MSVESEVDHAEGYLPNKKTVLNFSLRPPGYLKIRAKKMTNSTNFIVCNIGSGGRTPTTNYPYDTLLTNIFDYSDPYIHTISTHTLNYFPLIGNTICSLNWQVYNGLTPIGTPSNVSIFVGIRDTITYTIQFN